MKIEFSNTFHKTSGFCLVHMEQVRCNGLRILLTASQYKQIMRKLCGISGCACGSINRAYIYDREKDHEHFFQVEDHGRFPVPVTSIEGFQNFKLIDDYPYFIDLLID